MNPAKNSENPTWQKRQVEKLKHIHEGIYNDNLQHGDKPAWLIRREN